MITDEIIDNLYQIDLECFPPESGLFWHPEFFKQLVKRDGYMTEYHTNTSKDIVGFVVYDMNYNENDMYIPIIAVSKPYRSLGIGTRLMETVMSIAESLYRTHIYLHVWKKNITAIDFYEKLGFVKEKLVQNYYSTLVDGDAYLMKY